MSKAEKLVAKFYKKPVPNDITYDEVERIARYFGCIVDSKGGKHPLRVVHKETGTIIPIPVHGKTIGEGYIRQLKELFDTIREDD